MKKILLITVLFLLSNPVLSYGDDITKALYNSQHKINSARDSADEIEKKLKQALDYMSDLDRATLRQTEALTEAQQALQECQQQLNQQN